MLHRTRYTIGSKRDYALTKARKSFLFNLVIVILIYLIHYIIRYGQKI
mgnify:CR=1 FL=1